MTKMNWGTTTRRPHMDEARTHESIGRALNEKSYQRLRAKRGYMAFLQSLLDDPLLPEKYRKKIEEAKRNTRDGFKTTYAMDTAIEKATQAIKKKRKAKTRPRNAK